MKRILFTLMSATVVSHAQAAPVIDGASHTCKELREIVQANGVAVVRGWLGSQHELVAGREQCKPGTLNLTSFYDRSRDQALCLIGYTCEGSYHND